MVVNGDGNGASGSGKVAPNHENHAEFAEGVSESEDDGCDYAGKRERKDDAAKGAKLVGAENARGLEEFWIEAFEGGDERLNTEWKTVEHAGDYEAGEGESQGVAEEAEPKFTEGAAWTHGDEEIEAKDGWRKHKWKGNDGFDQEFGSEFGEGEPVSERRGENEKNCGDEKSEPEGEEEFGHERERDSIAGCNAGRQQISRNRIFGRWLGRAEF